MRLNRHASVHTPLRRNWVLIIEWLQWVALATWLGSMLFVSFIAAPAAFRVLPDWHTAGLVVGSMLDRFYLMSYLLGPFVLIMTLIRAGAGQVQALRLFLTVFVVLVVLGLNVYGREIVSQRMESLRQGMGRVEAVPSQDPRRMAFDRLHRRSVWLMGGSIFGGLLLIYLAMGSNHEPYEMKRWRG